MPAICILLSPAQALCALLTTAALLVHTACQTPVVESRLSIGDRAFADSRFEEAAEAWSEDDPALEAALLFRHALLCSKRRPACLPEDEQALLAAIARDHASSVFGAVAGRLLALQEQLDQARGLEPLLDECLRTSMAIDAELEAVRAARAAVLEDLHEAESQLTKLSRLAELQSFAQEVQRLQAELEAQKQENLRLIEELDALKRIDLRNE